MADATPDVLIAEHECGMHKIRPRFGCPDCSKAAHPPEPQRVAVTKPDLNNLRRMLDVAASGMQECVDMLDEILEDKTNG